MPRLLVRGTLLTLIMLSGLAFTLIAIVIARSPYTHGNLSPEGYNRTEIIYVGEDHPFKGVGLADPKLALTGDPERDGAVLFFKYGCASCHGLKAEGGAVGTDLEDASRSELERKVRQGPKGMPAFPGDVISDEELDKLHEFLKSLKQADADNDNGGAVSATSGR